MGCYGFRFSRPSDSLCDPSTREVLQMDALFERAGNGFEPLSEAPA
jgi:hypothetical protein